MAVRWTYGCSLNYNAVEVLLFGSIRAILVLPERQLPLWRRRAKPYQIPSPFREFELCYSGHIRARDWYNLVLLCYAPIKPEKLLYQGLSRLFSLFASTVCGRCFLAVCPDEGFEKHKRLKQHFSMHPFSDYAAPIGDADAPILKMGAFCSDDGCISRITAFDV